MICPHCKSTSFITKEYENVEIDQCKSCHGVWLDENELGEIVKNVVMTFKDDDIRSTIKNAFSGIPKSEIEKERLCPKCNTKLQPINYSVDSGIIIDRCPNNHGIWLDHFELEQTQQYREYWQESTNKSMDHLVKLVKQVKDEPSEKTSISFLYDLSIRLGKKLF